MTEIAKMQVERAHSCLDFVDLVLQSDWPSLVENTLFRLLRSNWRFGEDIDVQDLDDHDELIDYLFI